MQRHRRGFIQIIIIVILGVIVLSLLGVQLSKLTDNPLLRDNLSFLWNFLSSLWNQYIAPNIGFIFEKIKGLFHSS